MAKILAIAFGLNVKTDYSFTDVPNDNPYSKYIKAIYSNGVATGYEDDTFKPNQPLSRQHYAVFMDRAQNIDPNFVAKPIVEETKPVEMSMDMTIDDFKTAIANNPLFNIKTSNYVPEMYMPKPFTFSDERFKQLLIEGQQYVAQTNFKYVDVGGSIQLEVPNHVSMLPKGYLATQVLIETNGSDEFSFALDYTSQEAVWLTQKLFELLYPEENFSALIEQRATETCEAYAKYKAGLTRIGDFEGNSTIMYSNGKEFRIGTNAEMPYFWVEVSKE